MTDEQKRNRDLRKAASKADKSVGQQRAALKRKVRIFYDLQRLRMQTAGRTLDRATEIDLHETDIALLEARAKELHHSEKEALKDVEAHLKTIPAYKHILSDKQRWKGIGPTMAGVMLSEIDITRCNTPSALWRYAGLAPVACRRCKTCKDSLTGAGDAFKHEFKRKDKCPLGDIVQLKDTFASARSERGQKGTKLPFNRFLKTKMVGVAAGCLLKANSPWRKFYDDYKHRIESAGKGRTDGHRHQMAQRYMIKMLLLEFWQEWRKLEGLSVRVPYQEQYLDHVHG